MQWLTVNLTGHCSVYFKVMCFGAVIHIILGQTNESALREQIFLIALSLRLHPLHQDTE